MPTLSMRLSDDEMSRLETMAEATGRSKSFLAARALKDYLEREAWMIAEIQQGLKEIEAGDFATDEEMAALDAKWGKKHEG